MVSMARTPGVGLGINRELPSSSNSEGVTGSNLFGRRTGNQTMTIDVHARAAYNVTTEIEWLEQRPRKIKHGKEIRQTLTGFFRAKGTSQCKI